MSFTQDLRASVLQAAMQGKLTEQLETDTPVSELLANIKAEKNRLISEKKIKKEKPLSAISDDDIPFDIPESWKWVKMGELVKISTGKRDVNYGTEDGEYDFYTCSKTPIKSPTFSFEGECLVLPGNGANVGEAYYYNGQFEAYQRTYVLEKYNPDFNMRFLEKVLLWNWKQFNANKQFGSAIPYIKLGNLQDFPIPLSPIEEQKRIVRRIEEIMKHIDELEAIEEELKKLKEVFPADMKAAVLQAAMQGKLTEQLETDSSVDDLLEDIKKEREKLITEGKIKRSRTAQNNNFVAFDDVPFDIPNSWNWVKLNDIATIIRGLTFSTSYKEQKDNTILVLRGGNINGKTELLEFSDNIYVDKNIPNYSQYLKVGDTLIVASSGTKSSVGKSCYITEVPEDTSFGGFMMVVRPLTCINSKYISYQIKRYRQKIINDTVGYISNITNSILGDLLIPLPPIEEQQRIVDKLEIILPLIKDI